MPEFYLPLSLVDDLIRAAIEEDLGAGDLTTLATVGPHVVGEGEIVAREAGIVAGLPVAARVFHVVEPALRFEAAVRDSDHVAAGAQVARVVGPVRGILSAERVALNFLQHLSGIASRTGRFVELVAGSGVRILDTRKTIPGMRLLAKYAVRCGGGANHRFGLSDGILIKDNHIAAAGSVTTAVQRARRFAPHLARIEVEAERLAQVEEALAAGAEAILLDNMPLDRLREAVALCRGRALTEASGGITEENVRAVAETGVDFISIGALTHSSRALDLSLELRLVGP
ncbi:MAG: carboxylating nicotinate-nucleotide diphosphorylase [Armatimonadetes bacterium]|nr:carboxylating nicotinate-nucleotide diphosphorylase [Armatimonadota bacterium]